jgi:hypothetical protein
LESESRVTENQEKTGEALARMRCAMRKLSARLDDPRRPQPARFARSNT